MTKERPAFSRRHLAVFLLAMGLSLPVRAADYYVSANGNDANNGTSSYGPWQSIAKANSFTFRPGDRLLFAAGQTFAGTVQLTATDGGVAGTPVEIGSFGPGRATIDGRAGTAISLKGTTGIKVNNLNLVGLGRKNGNNGGMGVEVANAVGITIDQVEASGFQYAGVSVTSSTTVRLTNAYAHDNGYAGISAYGITDGYIGYSRALSNPGDPAITNNHSGNGIVVSGRRVTIEYCEAAYNGYDMQQVNDNGPVGIWCYDSDQVTIQYCISHNNTSTKGDGGGFDLDGGVSNSVVQYNYAYENKNYGFMGWDYGSSLKWNYNVYRFNIGVNNAGPGFLLGQSGGQGLSNGEVYNNLFYNAGYPPVALYGGGSVGFNFRNNIFVGPNTSTLVPTSAGLRYQANDYWCTNGGFNVGGYASLAAWADATGQEKLNNSLVGLNADPQLRAPANYEKLTDPTKLPTLTAFLVPASSPVVDKGLNLQALFNQNPGPRDFYRSTAMPAGNAFDLGVQEQAGSQPAPAPAPAPSTSGCAGTGSLLREQWDNVSGNTVASIPTGSTPSSSAAITQFEAPAQSGTNYAARVRGYLCVPQSGAYTFWLVADDAAELYLSTTDQPAAKVRIATCAGWTASNRDFTRYASQKSAPVQLQAGQRYYVEALHKQEWGSGYLAVAWQLPDGTRQEPVPGSALIPFGTTAAPAPTPAPTPAPAPAAPVNLAFNPGFEADPAAVQAPQGWGTWAGSAGTDADADYTETNGGAHAGTYHGTQYKASRYEVYTYQTVTKLANGLYTLRAWTKSSGGQTNALLLAKNYGGAQVSVSFPTTASGGTSGAWQQVELKNINVANGQCEIGVYSYASAGQWLFFDDVELVSQGTTAQAATLAGPTPAPAAPLAEFQSWPNPVQNELTVSYPSTESAQLEVRLVSLQTARLLSKQMQAVAPGNNQFTISTAALAPGLYLLQLNDGKRVRSQRISVIRP